MPVPAEVTSEEQVELAPENHWIVFPPLPPVGFAEMAMDWPVSMLAKPGVGEPAVRAAPTVSAKVDDEPEFEPLSVTVAQK